MGKELEYKLEVGDIQLLDQIMADPLLEALAAEPFTETAMRTEYYDAADSRFSRRHWTLRKRQEGRNSVVCVKTPTVESHTRGEWEIQSEVLDDRAIVRLVEAGAPKELLFLYGLGDVEPVCGAKFLRQHRMLRFPDGSEAELACDRGVLVGKTEQLPLCEMELELYKGAPEEMIRLVRYLCDTYALQEQPKSKVARARSLK
ncbi:MAG: CYTH domain-containing protein [Oscillospiraceae bacterium]|nr:CYTH domain-containing protein [Oscillospiraceae bacterium]